MKYTRIIQLTFVCFLSASTGLFADAASDTVIYDASYEGKFSGLTVSMRKKLIDKGDHRFHIESRAENFLGSIKEDSHFLTYQGALIPLSYRENRKLLGKSSDRRLTFDWKNKLVRYERKDKPHKNKENPLKEGVLDPALYQLKLQQEAFAGKETLHFSYAHKDRVKDMTFEKRAEAEYTLGKKTYAAVTFERVIDEGKKSTAVTLIPDLDYIIAKIEHTEKDGSKYKITLKELHYEKDALQRFYKHLHPIAETQVSKQSPL